MKNIFDEKYEQTPEQRLRNSLVNRKTTRSKIDTPRLTFAQKRKLQSLNIDDKLHYIRELESSNTVLVT